MRAPIVLIFLLSTQPALACHRYSTWSYPWPQPCKATSARPTPHKTWFVEIASEPAPPPAPAPEVEDPARAQAIEQLKQDLRSRAGQTLELQTIGLTQEEKRNGD